MSLFKRIVIGLNVYMFFITIGAFLGVICSCALVLALYHFGPVTNSYSCGHGNIASLCAMIGGAVTGTSAGCFYASKLLFQNRLSLDLTAAGAVLSTAKWATLGSRLRAASHYASAGGLVIACSGLGDPTTFMITAFMGLLFVGIGAVAFLRAHFLDTLELPQE